MSRISCGSFKKEKVFLLANWLEALTRVDGGLK